jgi:hypothetical protein
MQHFPKTPHIAKALGCNAALNLPLRHVWAWHCEKGEISQPPHRIEKASRVYRIFIVSPDNPSFLNPVRGCPNIEFASSESQGATMGAAANTASNLTEF